MKKNHLLIAVSFILFISLITAACSKSKSYTSTTTPPTSTGPIDTVNMSGMSFIPANITVAKGTVIIWVNKDSYAHTATSTDGTSFNSGTINGGGTFTYTANTAGTFNYQCNFHVTMGMVGVLTVTN
jgi:plastocyanin